MKNPFIIGIAGGSGSGKTHFQNALLESFSEKELCIISQDNYYKDLEEQTKDDNGIENFDLPHSIDYQQFYDDILKLRSGKTVSLQEYTFNNDKKTGKTIKLHPAPILMIEGIFTLYYAQIEALLDLKLFVDAPDFLMMKRRILRDGEERGYDLSDVLYRYEHHVMPAYHQFVEPSKKKADFIIPNESHFDRALQVMTAYLQQVLSETK